MKSRSRRGAWSATAAHLRKHGITPADADRLEQAMCTLIDFEGRIVAAGHYGCSVGSVVDALRLLVDGES